MSDERLSVKSLIIVATCFSAKSFAINEGSPLVPRTVGSIMRSLPIEGHAHLLGKNILYFETAVDSGIERARTDFKKGDVAYLPSSGSSCFFLNNVTSGKTMTPIGKLSNNIDALKNVKPGDVFCIYEETI